MKKFFGKVSKLPSPLIYILFLVALALLAFCVPNLSQALGFVLRYGIIGIFILGAIVGIIVNVADRKKKQ